MIYTHIENYKLQEKLSAISEAPATYVTAAVEQTLTCVIEHVDDGQAVKVSWRETSGGAVLANGTDYSVNQETVIRGNQTSVLTIKADKMKTFADVDSFTYICSAQSSQYPESPASRYFNIVADVLTKGELKIICSG